MEKYIGAHVSAAGGLEKTPLRAREIGATGVSLFTHNQRQWVFKKMTVQDTVAFYEAGATAG